MDISVWKTIQKARKGEQIKLFVKIHLKVIHWKALDFESNTVQK